MTSRLAWTLLLVSFAVLAACVTSAPRDVILDGRNRAPTKDVLVARGGVNRPFEAIARLHTLVNTGRGGDPIAPLVAKARALGADALIIENSPPHLILESVRDSGLLSSSPARISRHEHYVISGHAVVWK